ncbi:MgtC/SapB family protein [Leeuwenhoekiella sp. A2]|uniref:MgtC/SapB family protein n=1 Tax=Leeuwenhoekiella sp. A2 TaxID=3141460 RepID=UPI003A807060|tara:strand:+ start:987 stop:1418 length:432 start_codon:yes stop_codon:yes gene_type:complete
MEIADFAIKIGCAIAAGLIIGVERELKNKSAGLKTNTLVSLGSAVFVLISLKYLHEDNTDITRVLGQVVTGIGFLGAGTILQDKDKIKGLTTAATIWCAAAAGCLSAAGMFGELFILTFGVVIINYVFGLIDDRIGKRRKTNN